MRGSWTRAASTGVEQVPLARASTRADARGPIAEAL